jgi:hypothetical protein
VARTYDQKRSEVMSIDRMRSEQNVGALREAIAATQWTVADTVAELGGTRATAIELLRDRGNSAPSKAEISYQQRSINRWLNYEAGTGKQSRKPSAEMRRALNHVGRDRQAASNGFKVHISGEIAVQGYKRDRNATVPLSGDRALSFLDNPNWGDLGKAYLGDSDSLYGFGDGLTVDPDF